MPTSSLATKVASGVISFYDDRSKCDVTLKATTLLYEDEKVALVNASFEGSAESYKVLFDKESREALTTEFQFWYVDGIE